MYYEVYIDVLFASNFILDFILLLTISKVLKCPTTHGSICLRAAAGAGLTCVIIAVPLQSSIIKFLLFHMAVNTIMIKIGLKVKNGALFWEALGMLYVSAFLLGGILTSLNRYLGNLMLVSAAGIGGYFLMRGIWIWAGRILGPKEIICRAVLYTASGEHELQALLDTGNGLIDCLSGKPVSIVDQTLAKCIFTEEDMKTLRYVAYHTIGKTGVLPAVRIPAMSVYRNREYRIEEPMIGICDEYISADEAYQIILNPGIFE